MDKKTFTRNRIKTILILTLIFTIKLNGLFAQSQNWWRVNGNTPSSSEFLGTTNNQSIFIKTNNITRFTFGSNGDIIFNSLTSSSADRVLSIDATGKLSALSGTAVSSLFNSNGIGFLQKTGNDYYIPTGNLGLGIAPSPGFKLDVIGDARISNNLYVGGGIVITDQVHAATQVKGWDVKVDNDLNVTGSSSFTGAVNFKGNVSSTNLSGTGTGMVFADSNGNLFKTNPNCTTCPPPPPTNMCVPGSWAWFEGGNINAVNNDIGTCDNKAFILKANNKKSITIEPGFGYVGIGENNNAPTAALDIVDATSQGVPVASANHIKIYGSTFGDIESNGQMTLRYNPSNGFVVAPNYASSNNSIPNFIIKNGQTIVNGQGLPSGSDVFIVTNDPNNINSTNTNFKIKANGETYSRYIRVSAQNFPDYVFANNYKLMPLDMVEEFYKINKHLPEIPSAKEVEKNGLDLGEINKLLVKKIEELTIYMVEQNKTNETQQKMLIDLKKEIETLNKK